jgi:hypothetical protein
MELELQFSLMEPKLSLDAIISTSIPKCSFFGAFNFFYVFQPIDHGSKFICVNKKLKDIDKQMFPNKKLLVLVITNVVEVAPTKKKRVKPMEDKLKVPLKKNANKEVVDLEV